MPKTKFQEALAYARQKAKTAGSWVELHNALYGIGGKCGELFPTEKDRIAFTQSEEHAQISELFSQIRQNKGEPSRELAELTASANGTLTIRVPRTIHAALIAEAKAEGISLNQLCLAKLTMQLQAVH